MSQYNLSRPKKKRSRVPFLIVVSIFALSAGAIAAYLTQNKLPATVLPGIARIVAEPTSSLNAMRAKAKDCTIEARDQFVAAASRINEVFEDSFILAGGTSRIALAPVVANMQGATRELKALPVDACGKLVQENMATAYDDAVDVFLAFMRDDSGSAGLMATDIQLQSAYRSLLAYKLDVFAPFLLKDFFAWSRNENNKLPQSPDLKYISEIEDGKTRCDDYEMIERLAFSYYEASTHYGASGILLDMAKEAMLTPTPALCSGATWLDTPTPTGTPIPTATPSPTPAAVPQAIQFRIEGRKGSGDYSIEYQIGNEKMVAVDSADSTWGRTFVSGRGVQLLFRIIDRGRNDPATCVIVIDGKIVAQKTRGEKDKSVTCTATVPDP